MTRTTLLTPEEIHVTMAGHNGMSCAVTDGSKQGGSSPLGAAATHPASDTLVKILVTSTPPSHNTYRVELAGIDNGLQLGHTYLQT
jgi:hypothetical protein